jgi:diketogulonate reductase-like aldo/keto reductase
LLFLYVGATFSDGSSALNIGFRTTNSSSDGVDSTEIPTREDDLPVVGSGTWSQSETDVRRALPAALDCGYTHLDPAEGYQNEAAIGRALANCDRDEIFLTSEVLPSNLHYEEILRSLDASLKALNVEALDLYLIHWPNSAISLRETIRALERAHEQRLIRNVGASNFSAYQLEFVQKVARVPIAVNQFECPGTSGRTWWTTARPTTS